MPQSPHIISQDGEALIKHFEGCARPIGNGMFASYPDPASGGEPWTIGWGSTGPDIRSGTVWSQAQCDARFDRDAQAFSAKVATLVTNPDTTQHQLDALVDFTYNLGFGNLAASTLIKDHNTGNFQAAADQFPLWCHASGKVLPGLVTRRAADRALHLTPDAEPAPSLPDLGAD